MKQTNMARGGACVPRCTGLPALYNSCSSVKAHTHIFNTPRANKDLVDSREGQNITPTTTVHKLRLECTVPRSKSISSSEL